MSIVDLLEGIGTESPCQYRTERKASTVEEELMDGKPTHILCTASLAGGR